ncbi:MAG: tetratricopeptide repeat protein [Bacteroidales bacterium]|uniref:tetratricopeptide repeat protein n=1 Tax=Porphyromonas sp. TaxID=1924944 RepID=UPI00297133DB|nr:tetratricopeptide repeat protein [Porphyromonas sp.]MDD7437521.1 tetratricopeptide repeat protein [Bacteroidales bacterium]MDY3067101.1 tetratricopeptide repeat protein [Porphyromonas sp.]
MKIKHLVLGALFSILVVLMSSCAGKLKPLDARQVVVDPQPLVLQGGRVPVTITITFPAKWFNKNAEVRVTPVLKYARSEAWGTTYNFQGEKLRGNATTIAYSTPTTVTVYSDFKYKPEMAESDLVLIFDARINGKVVTLPEVKIGEGVVATEALASAEFATPAIAPDAFQRIIKEKYDADIHFLIQQANVRSSELNSSDVREWKDIVESADMTPNQNVDVEIQAYASPDGGRELNEKLSAQREKNTTAQISRDLKRAKADVPMSAYYTAQDWEGFQKLVEQSNIQDKELILSVLSMYKDPETREREIKNISSVFSQLADEILPQLRRSRLIANVEIIGKSDDEIANLSKNNPSRLNVEELLYSASLTDNTTEKSRIYTQATAQFPRDARAFNNLGVLSYQAGDYASAKNYFQKAASIAQLPEVKMNQGLLQLLDGNLSEAETLIGQATNVPELGETMGLIYMQQGKYTEAAKALYDVATNNGVLAQILNKDYSRAADLLGLMDNLDATSYYLQALIGARTSQTDLMTEAIRKAVQLNPSMATRFLKDKEFVRFVGQSFFQSALK